MLTIPKKMPLDARTVMLCHATYLSQALLACATTFRVGLVVRRTATNLSEFLPSRQCLLTGHRVCPMWVGRDGEGLRWWYVHDLDSRSDRKESTNLSLEREDERRKMMREDKDEDWLGTLRDYMQLCLWFFSSLVPTNILLLLEADFSNSGASLYIPKRTTKQTL